MRTSNGLVLEGRYRLDHLIATGGMGEVWKGSDMELDRDIAVKVLREEYAFDEGFLKRFRAEARHTAALSHDTIAALYDYGELDGRAYIVMELCAGRPLSDIIEENPKGLPEKRVVQLLTGLARALDAAHAKGVVHRDVKPENILVDEDDGWAMKITDFGIARSQDQARLTKSGLVMGTAQYLSPEQAMGKQATSLSDIYSLGIVAYEMLVGHRPFTGSSQVEIAMAQVKKQPPPLPESIGEDLRHLVMMALAKAPANRPRSAAAVARILESIQRGEEPRFTTGAMPPVTTGPPTSPEADAAPGAHPAAPTRTAAMPLPRTGRRRGVHHRSGPSGPSGMSAPSGPSAPTRSSSGPSGPTRGGSGPSAISPSPAAPADGSASSPDPAPDFRSGSRTRSERTVRSTGTGKRVGPLSVPGLVLLIIILVVIGLAIAGGTGMLPIGGGTGAQVPGTADGDGAPLRTMFEWVAHDHGTRTVGL